jgi:patatin-related protein
MLPDASGRSPAITAAPSSVGSPPIEFTNEIRYAAVMYGGVSLCIYINGVAQELLELVRATAPDATESAALTPTEELSASARMYRRLGQYLDSDTFDAALLRRDSNASIRTRFVVDVLSGTSAGGLNSIFLAKAIANNESMDGLKKLWMQEGDIKLLLNDKSSGLPGLRARRDPQSLLNSQRMYEKLLTALHEMDFPGEPKEKKPETDADEPSTLLTPLVKELDLYVTATDLRGLPVHIKLDNGVADEFRHRNVFRFRYGSLSTDFGYKNNPLLAFAARCTSAIPPAFEPMRLEDIEPVLRTWPRYQGLINPQRIDWSKFYPDYNDSDETGDFWQRDFGDGGFLDNKPFSYATSALMRRQAEHPVTRKLLYIEPNPQPLGTDTATAPPKPNALEHVLAALMTLPRYETIREDLETVRGRNRILARIDEVTRDLTRDVDRDIARSLAVDRMTNRSREQAARDFATTPLQQLIAERGISYGIYHRMKVANVTSDLALLLSDLLGYAPTSDECVALRRVLEEWRNRWFVEDPPDGVAEDAWPKTQTRFLLDFDLGYRLRRLYFLHRKINYFYRFSPEKAARMSPEELQRALPPDVANFVRNAESWQRFRQALLRIKTALARPVLKLRLVDRALREDKDLIAQTRQALSREDVAGCLRNADLIRAFAIDREKQQTFTAVSRAIASYYERGFKETAADISAALQPREGADTEEQIARREFWRIHCQFDFYDMAIFPVQFGAGSPEAPHVEILRVSPGDARNLSENQPGREKLAGTEFFSFGAFFAEFWRENDMLWGRLDGAEILVRNLLADTPAARTLAANDPAFRDHAGLRTSADRGRKTVVDLVVDDLQTAILRDHLQPAQRARVWQMLQRTLPHINRNDLDDQIGRFFDDSTQLGNAMRHIIDFCRDDEELLCHYKESYAVDRRLDRSEMLRIISRATKIIGKMLQSMADESGKLGKELPALGMRTAAIFNGIVELSLPRRPGELLWRYWRSLLYVIGALLFIVGLVFNAQSVQKGGLLILLVTAVAHVATTVVELWIVRRWTAAKGVFASLLALLLTGIFALGVWKAYDLSRSIGARALQWVQAIRAR